MVAALDAATPTPTPPDRGALTHALAHRQQQRRAAHPSPGVFRPLGVRMPALDEVEASLALLGRGPAAQLRYDTPGLSTVDGRTFYLTASPGTVGVAVVDENRRERSIERSARLQAMAADALATYADPATGELRVDFLEARVRGTITAWSRKSRARMTRRLAQLDVGAWDVDSLGYPAALGYADKHPLGMVTLTYPGDWLAVCPDGETAKKQLRAFRDAVRHAFGPAAAWGLWKLEFQRARRFGASLGQRAPHFHLLMRVPPRGPDGRLFTLWLSATWARIVGATGEERARHELAGTGVHFAGRMTDARRISVYFAKHGSKSADDKEYQHIVPRAWVDNGGPGRFWGVWGVPYAERAVELPLDEAVAVRRVLRRVLKARTRRQIFTLGSSGQLVGGTVLVNDGPAVVSQIARYLAIRRRRIYAGPDLLADRPLLP